jgi:putative hemolysin
MAVDEYGAIVGAVTLEDVLGQIVAGHPPRDRHEAAVRGVSRVAADSYLVDGLVPAVEARTRLGVPIPESKDYQTVAGFVLVRRGAVPTPGTSVDLPGWRLTVVEVQGPRIVKVRAERRAGSG